MSAVSLTMDKGLRMPSAQSDDSKLRRACNEFLGMAMFSKMLKQARESSLNGELFNSSAQNVFQGQLDEVLLRSATGSDQGPGLFGGLGDALYEDLSGKMNMAATGGNLDVAV